MLEEDQEQFSATGQDSTALNANIELKEVSDAIDRLKTGKAYLQVPNEVMKNENAKLILHKFLSKCFTSGMNPTAWQFSDIKPIPKPEKDPRDPMQNSLKLSALEIRAY